MLSPVLCGSTRAVIEVPDSSESSPTMKNAASVEKLSGPSDSHGGDFTARVKNFFSSSPLKRRRSMSLNALLQKTSSTALVFGVPLVDLVTREGRAIPYIVQKIVEHMEEEGLDQEGIYRVSGNAKLIDNLRCRFDKVGDAEFKGLDIAAVAGLLKLFLRELPSPIIPDDLIPKFVEIQHSHPGHPSPEALDLLRETLGQLPDANYTLLKYLMHHLARVVQHSSQNKMSPVSLSIVFGPNIFRCGSGLEGLRQQGYTNSVVCRMVQHYDTLFEPAPPSPSQDLKKGDRKRPKKPKPYTEHIQEKKQKESASSPPPMATVNGSLEGGEEYSERSIDEAIERSSGTFSPTSPTPLQNEDAFRESSPPTSTPLLIKSPSHPEPLFVESYDEQVDGHTFQRQYAKRLKKSKKETAGSSKETTKTVEQKEKESSGATGKSKQSNGVVRRPLSEPVARQPALKHPQVSSLNPHEDPDLTMRTPSPYSWQSSGSPGTSPPTSPSLTPKTSRVVSSVIADSVKQFLFEPSSSGRRLPRQPDSLQAQGGTKSKVARTDVYGLLLPDRADSPHVKKRLRQQSAITEPDSPSDVQENGLDQSDVPATDQTDGPGTNVVLTPLSTGIKMHQADTELTPTTPSIKAHTTKRRSRVKIVDDKKTKVDKSDQSDQKLDHPNTEGDVAQHPNAEKQSQPVVIRRRDRGERDTKKLRNRKSSLHGGDGTSALMEDTDVQIVSVRQEDSGTAEEIMSRKGKVSDLVRQFDETDSGPGVSGGGAEGKEEGKEESTPRKRKKPGLKAFKMFESSGIIMGMAPPSRPKVPVSSETDTTTVHESTDGSEDLTSATRAQLSTTLSEEDVFVSPNIASTSTASTSSHRGRRVQLPTTTSDDVFVSSPHTSAVEEEEEGERKDSLNELDVVERSGTLQHLTLNRPRGPHRRRPRRAISAPVASLANTATKEELEHGEDFTHSTGSNIAHNRLTRVQSTPVASITAASLAESEAEQQRQSSTKAKPEKRMERVSPKEHRKKVTVEGDRSKEKRQSSESPEAPSSTSRVPLLDLTTLAPENNSSEVKQGWGDGSKEDNRAGQPSQQATSNTATVKEMSHRIHELKAAIREFETDFVTKHGHKPSAGERSPVRPQLEELSKLRKSFRALKGRSASEDKLSQTAPPELPSTEIRPQVSTSTSVLSGSVLSTSGSSVSASSSRSSLHATLENVMKLLEDKRKKEGRPENIELMTAEQVMAEKQSIQKSLLQFEKKYGRPQTKEGKDTMRPLYDRYRLIKKHIASREANKSLQQDKSMTTTAYTLETTTDTLPSVTLLQSGFSKSLTMEATPELDDSNTKLRKSSQESRGTHTGGSHATVTNSNIQGSSTTGDISDKQLSEISLNDLHRQHEIALTAKKQLRKVLRDYEHEFTTAHGRAVTREDRKPMQKEYGEYRNIKGRLKLIETLISKNDPAKTL